MTSPASATESQPRGGRRSADPSARGSTIAGVDASDLGLLVLRLVVGLTFAAHGAQKAFGWWHGPGWIGWQNAIGRMGFRPISLFAVLSIAAELVGGLGVAFGIVTPFAAAILVAQSVVIVVKV